MPSHTWYVPRYCCAVVIGDRLKFLSVLLTLKQRANEATGSFDDVLVGEAARVNPAVATAAAAARDETWHAYVQKGLDAYNKHGAVSAAQRVQKFAILPLDFSTATGELTPTLKLKRAFVCEKHAALIKEIYTQNKSAVWLQQV